jgi:1-acyl-sn-glycerol-3-phosphate acyltransferase
MHNPLVNTLKIIWLSFWAIIATIVLFIPITGAAVISKTGNLAFSLSKLWAYTLLIATNVHPHILGREKIKKGQSYIIISNHQSEFDILALITTLGIQFRWIIKKELKKAPLFGYALYASRNIFIDRSNTKDAIKSINDGINRLPKGTSVMVFAEGTRSSDGSIQEFKKGGFITAIEKNLPILPVTVSGSRKTLPKKSLAFSPGPIEVVVGDPIETTGYAQENIIDLITKTRNTIISNYKINYPDI